MDIVRSVWAKSWASGATALFFLLLIIVTSGRLPTTTGFAIFGAAWIFGAIAESTVGALNPRRSKAGA